VNASSLRRIARLLVSVLLLISVIPSISSQGVLSQQFRTLTSYTTTTATGSSLEYYSQPTTLLRTTGGTVTFTLTHAVREGLTVCYGGLTPLLVNITRSQTIHVDISANMPTDFALYDLSSFTFWMLHIGCELMPVGFTKLSVTQGSFDIPVSPSGNPYWFVFIHRGPGVYPKISVVVNGILLQQPTFVTLTSTHMLTRTRTLTSYQTQEIPFLEANAKWLLPLAIVVIVAALLLVTWPRKKGRK
jgi:hypothetical protein